MSVETIFSQFKKEDYAVINLTNRLDESIAKIASKVINESSSGKKPVEIHFNDSNLYREKWVRQGKNISLFYKLMRSGYDISFSSTPNLDGQYILLHRR